MTLGRRCLVATPEIWDILTSQMSPGLQARFLTVVDLIEICGLEGLPTSIVHRQAEGVWHVMFGAPDGWFGMQVTSEAHGDQRPIDGGSGPIRLPPEMKSRLLQRPEVHKEWVRGETWFQRIALKSIAGMEEDPIDILPKSA